MLRHLYTTTMTLYCLDNMLPSFHRVLSSLYLSVFYCFCLITLSFLSRTPIQRYYYHHHYHHRHHHYHHYHHHHSLVFQSSRQSKSSYLLPMVHLVCSAIYVCRCTCQRDVGYFIPMNHRRVVSCATDVTNVRMNLPALSRLAGKRPM